MAEEKSEPNYSIDKLLPMTVIVTVLSQLSVISYYNHFGFSPLTYFESYEILIASTKDFILVFIILFLYYQFSLLNVIPSNMPFIDEDKLNGKFERNPNIGYIISISLVSISIICLLIEQLNVPYYLILSGFWIGYTVFNTANNTKYEKLITLNNRHGNLVKKYYISVDTFIGFITSLLVVLILYFSYSKYKYILHCNPYNGTELTLQDNKVIKCTSKVIFIGKSQKYYFIYNTPDSSIRVVKRDDIKKEVIKIDPNVNFFYRF